LLLDHLSERELELRQSVWLAERGSASAEGSARACIVHSYVRGYNACLQEEPECKAPVVIWESAHKSSLTFSEIALMRAHGHRKQACEGVLRQAEGAKDVLHQALWAPRLVQCKQCGSSVCLVLLKLLLLRLFALRMHASHER
jgi:aerobic-type carbon monoxide dehydrogenase small subunit (CoxS/CutS family)